MTTDKEYFIDISNNNGVIQWEKVKKALINGKKICEYRVKSSEGETFVDPQLSNNLEGAKSTGEKISVYHFGHPSNNPKTEAQHFWNTIRPYLAYINGKLYLDIEVTDNLDKEVGFTPDKIDNWALEFFAELETITKLDKGWYSGEYFAETYLTKTRQKYPDGWVAKYSNIAPNIKYSAWQYAENGKINGITGDVDLDEEIVNVISQAVKYELFDVVVKDSIYSAFVSHESTYVLWTAIREYVEEYVSKGRGDFLIDGNMVKGIVYEGNTYLPWNSLAKDIKSHKVHWLFSV